MKVFQNVSLVRSFFFNFWLLAGRIFLEYLLGWGYICIIYLWLVKYFLLLAEYFQTYKPGDLVADGKLHIDMIWELFDMFVITQDL